MELDGATGSHGSIGWTSLDMTGHRDICPNDPVTLDGRVLNMAVLSDVVRVF